MKIVHVMPWYMPKMGYQENYLPLEQKKLGHDIEIITADRYYPFPSFEKTVGHILGNRVIGSGIFFDNEIKIHRLPIQFEIKSYSQFLLKGLKEKLRELKPDIIHAHGVFTPSTLQTIFYIRKSNYQLVIDDHCHDNNFNQNSILIKTYLEVVKLFYKVYGKNISHFLPVTYSSKNIIQSILQIPEKNITLLHLGVDANVFKKSKELRKNCRKELNIKDNEVLFISTGKFTQNKDIDILIEAFKNIAKIYSNTKLLLVGNGPAEYMKYLTDLIDDLSIKEKVIFHDFVINTDLPKFYNAADIGIWPGDHTITAIEATATGLPVIIPSYNAAYSILFNNKSALGFERASINSLFEKISMFIQDKKIRENISTNALRLVETELSWEKIARKSIEIYLAD